MGSLGQEGKEGRGDGAGTGDGNVRVHVGVGKGEITERASWKEGQFRVR